MRKKYIKNSSLWLAGDYFGLDPSQVRELSDQELEALFMIVAERASRTSTILKISGLRTLVFMATGRAPLTVRLTDNVHKLKKILGSDFDPVKILRGE